MNGCMGFPLCAAVLVVCAFPSAVSGAEPTPLEVIEAIRIKDFRGEYQFHHERDIILPNGAAVRYLLFSRPAVAGTSDSLVFMRVAPDGALTETYRTGVSDDGVTPSFNQLVVVARKGDAVVVALSWTHLGNAQLPESQVLSVDKEGNITPVARYRTKADGKGSLRWQDDDLPVAETD